MKLVKSQRDEEIDQDSGQYRRLYDGETYLLLEAMSRDAKLNVDGIRKFLDDLVASSTKMGLGKYAHLFDGNDAMKFWNALANECNMSVVFDAANAQILMIGLNENVKQFQDEMLQIIKKANAKSTTSEDLSHCRSQIDHSSG